MNTLEKTDKTISEEVMKAFLTYNWPGNIRELKNSIEYAYMMSDSEILTLEHLPKCIRDYAEYKADKPIQPLSKIVDNAETESIKLALKKYGTSVEGKKAVAKALGISLASLYNKLKKIGEVS